MEGRLFLVVIPHFTVFQCLLSGIGDELDLDWSVATIVFRVVRMR